MCSAPKAFKALIFISAVVFSIASAAEAQQVTLVDGATDGVGVPVERAPPAHIYHRRLLQATDPPPPAPGTNTPDTALDQVAPQAPETFAAALPRCLLARQVTLVGQSVVTYDCRLRSPEVDKDEIAANPVVELPNSYIHGYSGSTSGLLLGLNPIIASAQPMEGQVPVLSLRNGSQVRLERLTLLNTTLGPPGDPDTSLRFAWLNSSQVASMWIVDVIVVTSSKVLDAYIQYFNEVVALQQPGTVFYTDNRTFLHINDWVSPSGVRATNTGILLVGAGDQQLSQPLAGSPLQPPAPVVLSATNGTIAQLLRRYAAQATPSPLLVYVGGNVTLAGGTKAGEPRGLVLPPAQSGNATTAALLAPLQNITVARPVVLIGAAMDQTSIDFQMRVNQLVLTGPYARLTLDSLLLENLGYGDIVSAPTANGFSMLTTVSLWAVYYMRNQPLLALRNCTAAIPSVEADFILYWSSLFEARMPASDWLRRERNITAYQVRNVNASGGGFTIVDLRAVGLVVANTQILPHNRVAPQLPLPSSNDGQAHEELRVTASQPPLLDGIHNVSDLKLAIANYTPKDNQDHVLLLVEPMTNLGPAPDQRWPPPGGLNISLPAILSGVTQLDSTADFGAGSGGSGGGVPGAAVALLRLPPNASSGFLQVRYLTLTGLGTGPLATGSGANGSSTAAGAANSGGASTINSSTHVSGAAGGVGRSLKQQGGAADAGTAAGGAQQIAALRAADAASSPAAGCWTMLLWNINRAMGGDATGTISVYSATLLLQPQEYELLYRLAQQAPNFTVLPEGSQQTMTFNGVSLQQDLDAILVGSMQGFNMIWRNVTLAPLDLPPSTPTNTCRWAPFDSSQSSSRDSGGGSSATTRTLAVALSLGVAAPVLAAAACCFALLGRRRRRARALSLLPAVGSSGCAKSAEAEEGGAETIGQGQGPGGDRPGGVIQLLARYGPAILSTVSAHQGSATASSGRFGSSSGTAGAAAAAPTGAEAAAPTVAEAEQPVAPTPHPQAAAPAREPGATEPSGWKRLSSAIGALSLNLQERRLAASIAAAGSVAGGAALSQRRVATASPMPSGDLDAGSSVTSGPGGGGGGTVGQARSSRESGASGSAPSAPQLQLHEVLGRGTFGQVWRATWKGSTVAVKVMTLPMSSGADACGDDSAAGHDPECRPPNPLEHMAVKEAAISASVSHPNVVQVFTYILKPLAIDDAEVATPRGGGAAGGFVVGGRGRQQGAAAAASARGAEAGGGGSDRELGRLGPGTYAVLGWELRLVMEYCELGSLRAALDSGLLRDPTSGATHLPVAVGLAHHIACAMLHLHCDGILHGDLKANNVLLRPGPGGVLMLLPPGSPSAAPYPRPEPQGQVQRLRAAVGPGGTGLIAKVADFGLSHTLSPSDTHISDTHAGTLTHMSPELLVHGRASKASDVYAYGILLWELATGGRAFAGMPRALIGHQVTAKRRRPPWPPALRPVSSPFGAAAQEVAGPEGRVRRAFVDLVERCWVHDSKQRPEFVEIVASLYSMLQQLQQPLQPLPQLPPALVGESVGSGSSGSGGKTYNDSGTGWRAGAGGGAAGIAGGVRTSSGGLSPTPEGTSIVYGLVGEVVEEVRLEGEGEGGEGPGLGEGGAAARQVPADAA